MFVAVDLRLRAKAGEFVGVAQVFDRLLSRRFFHAKNVTRFRPAENRINRLIIMKFYVAGRLNLSTFFREEPNICWECASLNHRGKQSLKFTFIALASTLAFVSVSSQTEASSKGKQSGAVSSGKSQTGKASWYGPGFHGRRTASGERFKQNVMTAAHRGRIIDLSRASAHSLGLAGLSSVTLTVL